MKIGPFSKKFEMTPASIRYYIEIGLLIPEKNGAHYSFNQGCLDDMEFIQRFKELGFHLHEISQILSIKRMTKFKEEKANALFVTLLENKKAHTLEEISKLNKNVSQIKEQIDAVSSFNTNYAVTGIPVSFLSLFACPTCGGTLSLNGARIEATYIMEGHLQCACGYYAEIEEGILIAGEQENKDIPQCSWASLLEDLNPEFINFQIRSYRWMLEKLRLEELRHKTFVTTDRFAGGFILENAHILPKENVYIIIYSSKSLLNHIKTRMDALELELNILYVLSDTFQLPIKPASVDIFIDDFSTSNFLFFHDDYPIVKLQTYLKDSCKLIGSLFLYKRSTKTIKNIQAQYPDASIEKLSNLVEYKKLLTRYQYQISCGDEPALLSDPGGGTEFSFHQKGDQIYLYNYLATR